LHVAGSISLSTVSAVDVSFGTAGRIADLPAAQYFGPHAPSNLFHMVSPHGQAGVDMIGVKVRLVAA
jgi:hypothetical protein